MGGYFGLRSANAVSDGERSRPPPRVAPTPTISSTNRGGDLRERPLRRDYADDFVTSYGSKNVCPKREETERFHRFSYDDLVKRDKLNLDPFWLKDASAPDPDTLPPPAEIAAEIVDSLETALEKFRLVAAEMAGG